MTTADRHTDLDPTVDRHRDGEGHDTNQVTGSHAAESYDTYGGTGTSTDTSAHSDTDVDTQGDTHGDTHVDTHSDTHSDAEGFAEREPSDYTDRHADDQPADHYGDAVPSTDESHLDGTGQHADATVTDPARTEGGFATDTTSDTTTDTTTDSTPDTATDGAGVTSTTDAVPVAGSATTTSSTSTTSATGDNLERLVPADRVQAYTSRWDAVKGEFVDEPRQAVAKADKLVGELLDELDQAFRKQRSDLEHGLDADETSTEDLRLALRKYRSFFDRLLTL